MFRACHAHHQEKQIVSIQLLVNVTPCWYIYIYIYIYLFIYWKEFVRQVGQLPRNNESVFFPWCSSFLLEVPQVFPRPFDQINLWRWVWNTDVDPNNNDSGKPKYSQINLSQRHFVHHNSHTVWPGLESNSIIFKSPIPPTQKTHWHSSAGRNSCFRLQCGKKPGRKHVTCVHHNLPHSPPTATDFHRHVYSSRFPLLYSTFFPARPTSTLKIEAATTN